MSDSKGEKEPDYQSDPRIVRRPKDDEEIPGSKRDHDLVAAVLIMTLIFTILGLWAMTHMYP